MEERSRDRVWGFMCSAQMASSLRITRVVFIKKKLDEVESGLAESSASSVNSNARARREWRHFPVRISDVVIRIWKVISPMPFRVSHASTTTLLGTRSSREEVRSKP